MVANKTEGSIWSHNVTAFIQRHWFLYSVPVASLSKFAPWHRGNNLHSAYRATLTMLGPIWDHQDVRTPAIGKPTAQQVLRARTADNLLRVLLSFHLLDCHDSCHLEILNWGQVVTLLLKKACQAMKSGFQHMPWWDWVCIHLICKQVLDSTEKGSSSHKMQGLLYENRLFLEDGNPHGTTDVRNCPYWSSLQCWFCCLQESTCTNIAKLSIQAVALNEETTWEHYWILKCVTIAVCHYFCRLQKKRYLGLQTSAPPKRTAFAAHALCMAWWSYSTYNQDKRLRGPSGLCYLPTEHSRSHQIHIYVCHNPDPA